MVPFPVYALRAFIGLTLLCIFGLEKVEVVEEARIVQGWAVCCIASGRDYPGSFGFGSCKSNCVGFIKVKMRAPLTCFGKFLFVL